MSKAAKKKAPKRARAPARAGAELLLALGRHDDHKKRVFIDTAQPILAHARDLESEREKRGPLISERDRRALQKVALCARKLGLAMEMADVEGSGAGALLREAWPYETAVRAHIARPGEPYPEDLPRVLMLLFCAARHHLPDKRAPGAPKQEAPATRAVSTLALVYRSIFGAYPAIGNGSPFIKFCRVAFPAHGLDVLSLDKIAPLVKRLENPPQLNEFSDSN